MPIKFELLDLSKIQDIAPLLEKLNAYKIPLEVLKQRCLEMATGHYECAVIWDKERIIGVCGLWYCTRHYSGRSVEVDHVYIEDAYRGQRLGKQFFEWIYTHISSKEVETIELNAYVGNSGAHKFYLNEGFHIIGYHFLKTL